MELVKVDYARFGKKICKMLQDGDHPSTILEYVSENAVDLVWAKGVLAGYMKRREGYITNAFCLPPKTVKDFFFDSLADDMRRKIMCPENVDDYIDYKLPFLDCEDLRWRAGSFCIGGDYGVLRYVELEVDEERSPSDRNGSYDKSGVFLDIAILHKGGIIYGIASKENAKRIRDRHYTFKIIEIDFGG